MCSVPACRLGRGGVAARAAEGGCPCCGADEGPECHQRVRAAVLRSAVSLLLATEQRRFAVQFEIDGTLINIMDTMTFPSGFTKREFVVRTDEMYPQEVKFELIKDKVALIDSYSVNEQVKVSFNIRGSLWQDKYFTNLQVCVCVCARARVRVYVCTCVFARVCRRPSHVCVPARHLAGGSAHRTRRVPVRGRRGKYSGWLLGRGSSLRRLRP